RPRREAAQAKLVQAPGKYCRLLKRYAASLGAFLLKRWANGTYSSMTSATGETSIMPLHRRLILVLALLVVSSSQSLAQTRHAPVYSLPAVGTWVEYEWKRVTPSDQQEKGILRMSCVGEKKVKGAACRWVEIKVQARRGDKTKWKVRKLLV